MIPAYEFLAPPQIVFGWGRRCELGKHAAALGRRALAVIGSRTLHGNGTWTDLQRCLREAGIKPITQWVGMPHEPDIAAVDALVAALRQERVGAGDFLLALGGGSAIDLAKAASAVVTNPQGDSVRDFLEGVGRGAQITNPPLPVLVMPTTGGTGSEATKNAVISVSDPPVKKSIRSPLMVPRLVLIDPELAVSVPPETTAWTGMDAITQLIESYICRFTKPIPQALAIAGLKLALPNLREAVANGNSRPAREALAQAALLSGMALANSGLGFAHGMAAALGVFANVPHGKACAMMLPIALRVNRQVAEKPLAELARAVFPTGAATDGDAADALIDCIDRLCAEIGVPSRLSQVGVTANQLDDLVHGSRGNSMNGNPRQLDDDDLHAILKERL